MADGPVSDEQLLRMLQEVEDRDDVVASLVDDAEAPSVGLPEEPLFDPCRACGEPAQHRGDCHVCGEEGCLPPDLWSPGQADPCLSLCVRCARSIHVGCASWDEAGNPKCPGCKY